MIKAEGLLLFLKIFPPVFVFNWLPHETPDAVHNTPLLPTLCFNVGEAVRGLPKQAQDFNLSPSLRTKASCVTLAELLNLSEPQFSHL